MSKASLVLVIFSLWSASSYSVWSHKEGDPLGSPVPHLVQEFTEEEWDASNFAPKRSIEKWRDRKYGMFIHFGVTSYAGKEVSWGSINNETRRAPDGVAVTDGESLPKDEWVGWSKLLKLEKFNAKKWVKIAQDSGFRYIVIVAKHHEGFHFWDTEFSDFKVTNTPFRRDYLKEFMDACREANMPVGLYYSQRDWYHPDYQPTGFGKDKNKSGPEHRDYIQYQYNVVRELATQYGKVDIFWWDAAWWGEMFIAEDWDAENLTRELRRLQPEIVMNNRASVPGDFDTPEQRLGGFQDWRPWESAIPLESTWAYSGTPHKSKSEIIRALVTNVDNNGNLLLSWGPHWDGEFDKDQTTTLLKVGEWLKENGESIYGTRGGPWKNYPWGGSAYKNSVIYLHVNHVRNERISIDSLPNTKVLKVALLNGVDLAFTENNRKIEIVVPEKYQNDIYTIIKLSMDKNLDNIKPVAFLKEAPIFSLDKSYGKVVSSTASIRASSKHMGNDFNNPDYLINNPNEIYFTFSTSAEKTPWVELDLRKEFDVTGLVIQGESSGAVLDLSFSLNQEDWESVWQSNINDQKNSWEIQINIQNAENTARYLRVQLLSPTPRKLVLNKINVWAKTNQESVSNE